MAKTTNTFNGGLNMDLSDMLMSSEMMRNAQNIRVIDLDGSNFAVTLLRGTEESFTLTEGYIPLVTQEFDGVLYIISGKINNDASTSIELGSYPSPELTGDFGGTNVYRPFRNIVSGSQTAGIQVVTPDPGDGPDLPPPEPVLAPPSPPGAFNTTVLGFELADTIDMEIQPDFDGSVNVIFGALNRQVRIVNSNFVKDFEGIRASPVRPEGATSNTYTTEDLDDETALVVSSSQVMGVDLISIEQGGSLIYGNYQYYFYLQTDDFAQSPLAGHSMLCQVFEGTGTGTRGGTISDQTSKRVALRLTNIDTSFTYLKVYFSFASGDEQSTTQLIEIVSPIRITGSTMTFTHTGFETTGAVSPDVINYQPYNVDSAATLAQAGGFLFLANITERNFELDDLADFAQSITINQKITSIDFDVNQFGTAQGGYGDYENTYRRLGYRGGETYPFGMVFILNDGSTTPVFPIPGKDVYGNATLSEAQKQEIKEKGLFRFDINKGQNFYDETTGQIRVRHLNALGINPPQEVLDKTIGFFFVRGERIPNQLVQGYLIPVLHVAPSDVSDVSNADTLYYDVATPGTNEYGMVPTFDGILEAWRYDVIGGEDFNVINEQNQLDQGYMPFIVKDMSEDNPAAEPDKARGNLDPKFWAFISIDQLANEPELVTLINQRQAQVRREGDVLFEWGQKPEQIYIQEEWSSDTVEPNIGMFARVKNLVSTTAENYVDTVTLAHVAGETFATGASTEGNRTFTSKVGQRFIFKADGGQHTYIANQNFNSYFGVAFANDFSAKTISSPYSANFRYANRYEGSVLPAQDDMTGNSPHTYGVTYQTVGKEMYGAHFVSIYPQSGISDDITRNYEDIGNITYRICSPRYSWADIQDGTIDIFGGDTFITSGYRKLSQSGFRQTNSPADFMNINMGISFQLVHESKYNAYLRHPERFDASEVEDRSFFPFKGNGDHNTWRRYRYPETSAYNLGFEETEGLQSFIAQSEFTILVKNNFYTRVLYSNRYIPNAFRNGYRSFGSLSFRDYDASLGAIIQLVNHHGLLLIVFEHGVGITSVEQRVQSGADQAGAVFLEAGDIIPANIQFLSRTIGAQDGKAVIVTPQAVYGMDREKDKIWQVAGQNGLRVISDDGFSSFLTENPIVNPRLGYDFQYNEVVFTTDNWTLCYREGMEKFTSFYSFKPELYATVGKEFRSFFNGRFHLHGANTRRIYGNTEDMYVEFVINEGLSQAKVFDYINILSNEVRPTKVEFFTYDIESKRYAVLDTDLMQQYSQVLDEADPFRDGENKIVFRDKRFAVQIPNTEIYNGELDRWGVGGRMRNDYLIVRLTYNTDKAAKVTAVLTEIRPSFA